jgi:hypothetical protein
MARTGDPEIPARTIGLERFGAHVRLGCWSDGRRKALRYFASPEWFDGGGISIYLAGGITGCRDWQSRVTASLRHLPVSVLNPRQARYPGGDPAFRAQVKWEYHHIRHADVLLFWFPAASLQR